MSDQRLLAAIPDTEALITAYENKDGPAVHRLFEEGDLGAMFYALAQQVSEMRAELVKAHDTIFQTRGIKPAGLSLSRVWEITNQSLDRKEAA